jgi:hypothetical protein
LVNRIHIHEHVYKNPLMFSFNHTKVLVHHICLLLSPSLLIIAVQLFASYRRCCTFISQPWTWPFKVSVVFLSIIKHRDSSMQYEGVSKSSWTGHLEQELKMVQLFFTRGSCIAILWVSLVSFSAITLCVAFQRAFIVFVYFIIDSVQKLFNTPL